MGYYKNAKGCSVNAIIRPNSDFWDYFLKHGNAIEFAEAVNHKLLDAEFCEGRTIYVQICGYRKKQIPKRVETAKQLADWINKMDF